MNFLFRFKSLILGKVIGNALVERFLFWINDSDFIPKIQRYCQRDKISLSDEKFQKINLVGRFHHVKSERQLFD